MDMGSFNLFIKMIVEEYKLSQFQIETLRNRLLADDQEFEMIWALYKCKSKLFSKGVDPFKSKLLDLIT